MLASPPRKQDSFSDLEAKASIVMVGNWSHGSLRPGVRRVSTSAGSNPPVHGNRVNFCVNLCVTHP